MQWIIAGLGNPGEEYKNTRHNSGRIMLEFFRKKNDFSDWEADKKLKALVSDGKLDLPRRSDSKAGKNKVLLLEPETFMNNSGKSIAPLVKTKKSASSLIVIYDDLDLPIGSFKISFNRGSGGHRGLESIIKSIKTREFARVRVGIASTTPSGKVKKPQGDKAVHDYIIGNFKDKEFELIKKVSKKINEALAMIISEGREKVMGVFN